MRQSVAQALAGGLIAVAGGFALAVAMRDRQRRRRMRRALNDDYDYSDRSGFPRSVNEMRGIARSASAARGTNVR